MGPRPYPLHAWPKLEVAHVHAANAWLRWLAALALRDGQACAAQLLGATPQLQLGAAEPCSSAGLLERLQEPLVGLLLEQAAGGPEHRLVIECAPSEAARLVDLTLGGDGEQGFAQVAQPLDDLSLGVLAYLAARVLASSTSDFVLRAVLRSKHELLDALGSGSVLVVPTALQVARHQLSLRVLLPLSAAERLRPQPGAARPAWLDSVPLTLCAEAGRATLELTDLAILAAGDVVLLDHSGLAREPSGFCGEIALRVAGSGVQLRCEAADNTLLVTHHAQHEERTMTTGHLLDPQRTEHATAALPADAPIELCAELARFTLPLGELSLLGPGQVLSTGRRIGEAVTLRAAGRAIAEGELVDVDGETGVRILRLLPG